VRFNQVDLPHQERVWAIEKDHTGFLWFGSDAALLVFDGYDVKPMDTIYPEADIKNVRKLLVDQTGVMWIGTKGNGLYRAFENQVVPVEAVKANNITAIHQDNDGIWVGTDEFLYIITSSGQVSAYRLPSVESTSQNKKVTAIETISDTELLVATQHHLYQFDKNTEVFKEEAIEDLSNSYINELYIDEDKKIWVATNTGVFVKDIENSHTFIPFLKEQIDFIIKTIAADEDNYWFGSLRNGLVKVSKHTSAITKFKNKLNDNTSISGDTIIAMLLDDSGVLFTSDFQGGLSYFSTQSLAFGLENNSLYENDCTDSPRINGIDESDQDTLWLSTESGLIELNTSNGSCNKHDLNKEGINAHNPYQPLFSFQDGENNRWVTTAKGINKIDPISGLVNESYRDFIDATSYFMFEVGAQEFLIGSSKGLYRMQNGQAKKIATDPENLSMVDFYHYTATADGYYFATEMGVAVLNGDNELGIHTLIQSQLPNQAVYSVFFDDLQNLWVGVKSHGLYKFDKDGKLLIRYDENHGLPSDITVFSLLRADNDLWLGTNNGLARLNMETNSVHVFHTSDGLQDEYFISGSAYQSTSGKLYFGGRNGFNAFYPKNIKTNTNPPKIALTQLTRFGKAVKTGIKTDGFEINRPINELENLELSHKDYVVGFEFTALDFADSKRNRYAFKMEGLDPDWNLVGANDRKISYSNLAPGDYTFRVKGANKDGTWNETGKSLQIKVLPAPWFTWWAYSLYVLTGFALLFAYIYRKNQANAAVTKKLRFEVDKQTKALQIEKSKVEELLQRKNELFANVSHEFRTPLTLILGPINKLLTASLPKDNIQSLEMINRNANRLLTMIEQLLQLAKMSSQEEVTLIPQQVHTGLEVLVSSFQTMAEHKKITLTLLRNDHAAINGTQDLIDVVFGNLISNALKYTQPGGSVSIISRSNDEFIDIEVTDNGCGLDKQQQSEIFNRFSRLESHHDIAGVGIGLSVVEEMLKINNGCIQVISEPGKGSTFAVRFKTIEFTAETITTESNKTLLNQLLKEPYSDEEGGTSIKYYGSKENKKVLIIDDNSDMRTLVAETLQHQYHCITADRGKAGIAEAIKWVPDIIICDVMMPEMDGFQVSRILRSDTRTSHIPLILLTALNSKKSRIKGWRENIDVYLTKPFDAQELIIQLENILVIRNILSKKAGAALKSGKISVNSGLPKNDQLFVDKFMQMIEKMYTEPYFLRPQMASMMAVSERQLQRKMKALVDQNPLDLLREYRLEKAAVSLKDGNQVSITADNCGFNSVTYFSKCFKKRYGVSPKVYQQTCNNRPE
jgi:signal transduction histidine kinase/ligand-binding sensor domain-containing protein/CheY-like chemotaxis protein/AraC-like DNA-binding protein